MSQTKTTLQLAAILVHITCKHNATVVHNKKWFYARFLAVGPEVFVVKGFLWQEYLQL